MDLEHLTKHQIVLLTLLISFVTSIATGIVTVALMNQAPPEISRTINQIVERTVQTVASPVQQAAVASSEKTVVVKEDDLTSQSIASVQKSIVRIVAASDPDTLVARGVIVAKDGTALTDRAALLASGASAFKAILPGGEVVEASASQLQATSTDTLVLQLAVGTTTGWAPAVLADPGKISLGSSVIRIGGTGADTVGVGVVAAAPHAGLIEASVPSATPGSIIFTLFGEVAGITTGASAQMGDDFYSVATLPPSQPAAKQPAQSST